MSKPTRLPASIVADTITPTIELGVTITDAAFDGEATVIFCDLQVDGPDRCPRCGSAGRHRDTIVHTVTDLPVAGHLLQLRVQVPRLSMQERLVRPGGVPAHY